MSELPEKDISNVEVYCRGIVQVVQTQTTAAYFIQTTKRNLSSARLLMFLVFFMWMFSCVGSERYGIAAGQLRPDSQGTIHNTSVRFLCGLHI